MGSLEIKEDDVRPVDLTARERLTTPPTDFTSELRAILVELGAIGDSLNLMIPRVMVVCDAVLGEEGDESGISVADIVKCAADYHCVTIRDIRSHRRDAEVLMPRQIAMYLCRTLTMRSLPQIGAFFGGRDHTTVLHAVRKITALMERRADLRQQVDQLTKKIRTGTNF